MLLRTVVTGAVAVVLLLLIGIPDTRQAVAQAPAEPPAKTEAATWRVATRVVPPFVVTDRGELTGFSIELWRAITDALGVQSEFVVGQSLPDMFASVDAKRADLAIAAISITAERETRYDFSVPMFEAGLQVAIAAAQRSTTAVLPQLFRSRALLELLGVMALLVLVPAHFIWFFESRHEDDIVPRTTYIRGIGNAAWWAATSLAGQAEEQPKSVWARLAAVAWMIAGICLITYFTAVITTSMTVDRLKGDISGPQDLPGKRVATIAASTSAAFLRTHLVEAVEYVSIDDAIGALDAGKVAAIVYDAPVLRYRASHDGKDRLRVVGPVFRKQSYGILFPPNDPRRKQVNAALLRLRENGRYDEIYAKWFGSDPSESR